MLSAYLLRLLLLMAAFSSTHLFAQNGDPNELVRQLAEAEVAARKKSVYYSYHWRNQTPRGTYAGVRIETPEGSVARAFSLDGRPLSPQEHEKWENTIDKVLSDRDLQRKRMKAQQEDYDRVTHMFAAIPDAFVCAFDGLESASLLRLKCGPNPKFKPAYGETRPMAGMQGTLWVNSRTNRIVGFEGTLVRDVDLGWGVLGRLHKGGTVAIENFILPEGASRLSSHEFHLAGRILLVKALKIDEKGQSTNFQRVSEQTTLTEAVRKLRAIAASCAADAAKPDCGIDLAENPH